MPLFFFLLHNFKILSSSFIFPMSNVLLIHPSSYLKNLVFFVFFTRVRCEDEEEEKEAWATVGRLDLHCQTCHTRKKVMLISLILFFFLLHPFVIRSATSSFFTSAKLRPKKKRRHRRRRSRKMEDPQHCCGWVLSFTGSRFSPRNALSDPNPHSPVQTRRSRFPLDDAHPRFQSRPS